MADVLKHFGIKNRFIRGDITSYNYNPNTIMPACSHPRSRQEAVINSKGDISFIRVCDECGREVKND